MIMLLILTFTNITKADNSSPYEPDINYELQIVYPVSGIYLSDFGIGMQGKNYIKPNFYLGWYAPVRFILPFEHKSILGSIDSIDCDIQAKLMGTAGYTIQNRYFGFDTCLMAGWRYWYYKTTQENWTYNANNSYESRIIKFELGMMSTIRWKLGETFGIKSNLNRINVDFYVNWPFAEDLLKTISQIELGAGLSYSF